MPDTHLEAAYEETTAFADEDLFWAHEMADEPDEPDAEDEPVALTLDQKYPVERDWDAVPEMYEPNPYHGTYSEC